jgi:RNA polymerase sigma-70 factor, ECF subfamily
MEATEHEPPARELTDDEVVVRVLGGETALFEVLMRRHNQRVFRACRAIVRDDAEAEDVMQEAYVRAYSHLSQFAGLSAFSTWLTRIAIHEAYARVRRQRRFAGVEAIDVLEDGSSVAAPAPVRDPERAASDRELAHVLESAIDALPEAFRAVFMLRMVEGMSGAETADCLGIPEETVKTRLFRARGMLRSDVDARTEGALKEAHRFLFERCDRVVAAVLRRIGAGP